jgi:hypothetical protein
VKDLATVRHYQELGVSRIVMSPPALDPETLRRGLEDFAERIVSKL